MTDNNIIVNTTFDSTPPLPCHLKSKTPRWGVLDFRALWCGRLELVLLFLE
jgi:hypothetical protein